MAIIFRQTNTAADNGANVGCSGQTLATTPNSREIIEGGTAGSTEVTFDITNAATRASMMFQTDVGKPGTTDWTAGNYVVRLNVSTTSSDILWVATYICERTTGGTYNTVASLTGQTTSMGTTGVKTHTVNRGTNYTAASSSTLYIVCVFQNTHAHTSRTIGITPNQNIDTPITPAGTTHNVSSSDGADAGDSATAGITSPVSSSDGAKASDAATADLSKDLSETDGADAGDTATVLATYAAQGSDGARASDTPSVQMEAVVASTDGAEASDAASVTVEEPQPPGFSTLTLIYS